MQSLPAGSRRGLVHSLEIYCMWLNSFVPVSDIPKSSEPHLRNSSRVNVSHFAPKYASSLDKTDTWSKLQRARSHAMETVSVSSSQLEVSMMVSDCLIWSENKCASHVFFPWNIKSVAVNTTYISAWISNKTHQCQKSSHKTWKHGQVCCRSSVVHVMRVHLEAMRLDSKNTFFLGNGTAIVWRYSPAWTCFIHLAVHEYATAIISENNTVLYKKPQQPSSPHSAAGANAGFPSRDLLNCADVNTTWDRGCFCCWCWHCLYFLITAKVLYLYQTETVWRLL